jgi:hypothetical protein
VVRVSPRLTMAGSCHRGPASQPRAGLAPGAAGPATAGIIAPLLLILAGAVRQARSQGGIRMAHNGARDVSGDAPGLAPGTPVLWPPVLHRGCNDCRPATHRSQSSAAARIIPICARRGLCCHVPVGMHIEADLCAGPRHGSAALRHRWRPPAQPCGKVVPAGQTPAAAWRTVRVSAAGYWEGMASASGWARR